MMTMEVKNNNLIPSKYCWIESTVTFLNVCWKYSGQIGIFDQFVEPVQFGTVIIIIFEKVRLDN